MSLKDIILSLLRQPMSGTDLIQLFRGTISHFWSTDLSQIYRALEALEADGCLTCETVQSPRGPARKVYSLTGRGQDRLAQWIRQPPKQPTNKFEYLAQLFSVGVDPEPRERARDLLLSMRADAEANLKVLETIELRMQKVPGYPEALPVQLFYPWMTSRHGLRRRGALLEWIDESLRCLDKRSPESDVESAPEDINDLLRTLGEFGPMGPLETEGRNDEETK